MKHKIILLIISLLLSLCSSAQVVHRYSYDRAGNRISRVSDSVIVSPLGRFNYGQPNPNAGANKDVVLEEATFGPRRAPKISMVSSAEKND